MIRDRPPASLLSIKTITMKSRLFFSVLFLLFSLSSFAHAVWIETDAKGVKGKTQAVKIFFGEYGSGKPDTTAKWFSNLRDIQLFLTTPDGTRSPLTLKQQVEHYTAEFTPSQNGVYLLSVSHTVAALYREGMLEYYATASVAVDAKGYGDLSGATALALQPVTNDLKSAAPLSAKVFFKQSSVQQGTKVILDSRNNWTKTENTDNSGSVSFTPPSPGRYMIEAIHYEDRTGTHNDKPYKKVTHVVTHCITVP